MISLVWPLLHTLKVPFRINCSPFFLAASGLGGAFSWCFLHSSHHMPGPISTSSSPCHPVFSGTAPTTELTEFCTVPATVEGGCHLTGGYTPVLLMDSRTCGCLGSPMGQTSSFHLPVSVTMILPSVNCFSKRNVAS